MDTRIKLVEEANGGTCTGKPTEIVQCNEEECAADKDGIYFVSFFIYFNMYIPTRYKYQFSLTSIFFDIVDCEWNEWIIGTCSSSCGGGTRTNTRSKNVSAEYEGDECEGTTSITESCNVQECPGNLVVNK